MPSYDTSHYNPPAPVAQVTLRDIASGTLLPNIFLLVDTGADITLIPKSAADLLGVQSLGGTEYQLLGFDGTPRLAQAVDLDMIFLNKVYRGRYLLIDSDQGILGRDVLSNVVLLLNGPRQEWNEHSSA